MEKEKDQYICSQCKKQTLFDDSIVFEFENLKFTFCSKECWKEWVDENIIK